MVAELAATGRLHELLLEAEEQTEAEMDTLRRHLIQQGLTPQQAHDRAWEIMRERYLLILGLRRNDGEESGSTDIMKPLKASPIQVRRQFDAPFKREAVANWLASGKSADVVALELGLRAKRLYAWRNLLDPAAAGGRAAAGARAGTATDLQSQLEAARRENRHLRAQRDILKNIGYSLRTVPER